MVDINVTFCRNLLKQIKPNVWRAKKRIFKDSWVYDYGNGHWEFHGPDQFYWHGSADNSYHARYQGWTAWLKHKGLFKEEERAEG